MKNTQNVNNTPNISICKSNQQNLQLSAVANQTFYLEDVIFGLFLGFASTSMLASCIQTVQIHATFAPCARFLCLTSLTRIYVNI